MQEDRAEASRAATLAQRPPRESAREPAPVVTLSRVGKRFGPVEAVRDIDLAVDEGEFVCLVGPSGSGKSTLLNMAAGLFPPSSGIVRYRGELVSGINRRVGYMTQSDHLLPWRTVARNIAVPLEIAGDGGGVGLHRAQAFRPLCA